MIRIMIAMVLACAIAGGPVAAQTQSLSIIRNNSITSLTPTTPPMASLFDSQSGRLLGQEISQPYRFATYGEPIEAAADGPLVLYQLSDASQTLFLSKLQNGELTLRSFSGNCRQVNGPEMIGLVNSIAILFSEFAHAQALYGVSVYSSGVVCTDSAGVLAVATVPVSVAPGLSVGLAYLRDGLDVPHAFITTTSTSYFGMFNLDGGVRYNALNSNAPVFEALDSSGNAVTAPLVDGTTCHDFAVTYHQCKVADENWRNAVRTVLLAITAASWIGGPPTGIGLSVLTGLTGMAILAIPSECNETVPPDASCPLPAWGYPQCASPTLCARDTQTGAIGCYFTSTSSCTSDRTCGGPLARCDSAICLPDMQQETCNNHDDNCDGRIDEGSSALCDDHDPCTADSCTATSGCAHAPIPECSQCVPSPSGLVSWWASDGSADDSTGSHNGALHNGASYALGEVGQAFDLDGTDDYVEVPDSDDWAFGTEDFTIDLWVNFASLRYSPEIGVPAAVLIANDEGPGDRGKWVFALGDGRLSFHINDPFLGVQFLAQSEFAPVLGEWYHLAITRSLDTFTTYINGMPTGSETMSITVPNAAAPLTIGESESVGTGQTFFTHGRLDEVDIFNRALSAAQIRAIFIAGNAGKCIPN